MASKKILEAKEEVVKKIKDSVKNSESIILFSYQGLTVADISELRRNLKDANGEVKIYKNTLVKRALDELNIKMDPAFLDGPNATGRIGVISGDVADLATINKYASIPSRETLLTQLAGGMIQYVKDLSIALNLYSE